VDTSKTIIHGSGERKAYEKGVLSFLDVDREVKILQTTELLIGRDQVCDIYLPDHHISRKHAVLQLEYGAAKFVDLMSSNGCTRNGEPVQGTIILNDGDNVTLGGAISLTTKVREEGESVKSVTFKLGKQEYLLTQSEILIGRNASATDITINDPLIDTLHAQLEFLFDAAIISSLDKEKPIIIDGHATQSSQLKDYTSIQIGNTRLTWRY